MAGLSRARCGFHAYTPATIVIRKSLRFGGFYLPLSTAVNIDQRENLPFEASISLL
jgi:hypothetical protein